MPSKTHLPALLVLLVLGLSAPLLLLAAVIMGGMSVLDLISQVPNSAAEMINAVTFVFQGILVALCGWFVLQKVLKRASADQLIQFEFANAYGPAVFAIIIPAVIIGGLVAYQEISFLSWVILPLLTVIIIALPVWLLLGVGSRGIELGPRWRFFGIFGLGMTLSPFVMVVLEFIVLVVILVIVGIYLALAQPALFKELSDLLPLLRHEANPEVMLQLLLPYIFKPGVIVTALLYVAFLVPLIEEGFKPLAVWLFARSIETPAQGFVLGLLSGAAFGMLESLNASADGSATWPLVVSVRAGTTLLHITASGLMGWGIVSAFKEKKYLRLIAAYACSVTIHGLWNACALGAGLSSVGNLVSQPEWLTAIVTPALGGMAILGIGMLIILITANNKLRSAATL